MYRYIATILMIWSLSSPDAYAQFHIPVFPELEGSDLIDAVAETYKPPFVLSYSDARDTLYRTIDARNDTLYCVYTGYGIYMPPGEDPSDAAFQNGSGINAEHTYPRSKGTQATRPNADMQHIFPSRADVNSDRGSFPFFDVPDNQTQTWYNQGQQQSTIPPSGSIDLFSELGNMTFEPRESHKGDVARAMFYVYTVYRSETDAADPLFFQSQRTTLCLWNEFDPVDAREFDRTFKIANHQGGATNPFIIDCTLATRTYCGDVTPACIPTGTDELTSIEQLPLSASPNPANQHTLLNYYLPVASNVRVELFDAQGRMLQYNDLGFQTGGEQTYELSINGPGNNAALFCRLIAISETGARESTIKLLTKK